MGYSKGAQFREAASQFDLQQCSSRATACKPSLSPYPYHQKIVDLAQQSWLAKER
jgi:hypothetical protein